MPEHICYLLHERGCPPLCPPADNRDGRGAACDCRSVGRCRSGILAALPMRGGPAGEGLTRPPGRVRPHGTMLRAGLDPRCSSRRGRTQRAHRPLPDHGGEGRVVAVAVASAVHPAHVPFNSSRSVMSPLISTRAQTAAAALRHRPRRTWRRAATLVAALTAIFAAAVPAGAAQPGVTQIRSDPHPADSLPTAAHATEVEPDTFLGLDGRRRGPIRTRLRRRRQQHLLGHHPGRRGVVDGRVPAQHHHGVDADRSVLRRQRSGGRIRCPPSRLDDLLARLAPVRRRHRGRDGEPVVRRRADLGRPDHGRRRRRVLRQELDGLRQLAEQPVLRQLLHRVRPGPRQHRADVHLDQRRADLGRAHTLWCPWDVGEPGHDPPAVDRSGRLPGHRGQLRPGARRHRHLRRRGARR